MKWQRQDSWVGSQIDDSYVMINLDHGAYVALNATAAEVWELLAEARGEDELVTALTDKFDVEAERCRESVRGLIDDLAGRELIQAVD